MISELVGHPYIFVVFIEKVKLSKLEVHQAGSNEGNGVKAKNCLAIGNITVHI